jgi:hypothetical protein
MRLLPRGTTLDRIIPKTTFVPYFDADTGVSRSIIWRISGDTASVVFDSTAGTVTYRCLPVSGYLTLWGIARADTTIRDSVRVAVQGHPAATNDPPCSGPTG